MNSRIITLQNQEMFFAQNNVVLRDDFPFQRGGGHTEFLSRSTDDGPGLQENDPILRRDVIGMDRDIVTGNLSFEDTHFSDFLAVLTLSFGEVHSGLEYDSTSPTLRLPAIPFRPGYCLSAGRMHPMTDLSTVAVNDSFQDSKSTIRVQSLGFLMP